MLKNRDIVIISPQAWGGMWVSKHWIAHELSKDNRVLFVGPEIWLGGAIRNPFGSGIFKKLFKEHRGEIKNNLNVFSPIIYPALLGRIGLLSKSRNTFLDQLKYEMNRLGFRDIVLMNFRTQHHTILGKLGEKTSIYYCVDPPFPNPGEEEYEKITCDKSSMIFAVSQAYKDILKKVAPGKDIFVVPHGYDFNRASLIMKDERVKIPDDLKDIPHPVIGYVGSIHDMTINVELIVKTAECRPNWSFVLIGPHKNNNVGHSLTEKSYQELKRVKNIYLLGPKHYFDLPNYIKFFDVCLVLINHKLDNELKTKQRTSFKLLQYLSQGKAIVTPPMNELYPIKELFYMEENESDFLKGIESALNENGEKKKARIQYAAQFSYEKILSLISSHIHEFEEQKEG